MEQQTKQQADALLGKVSEFIDSLSEAEIRDLLAGRRHLTVVDSCPTCGHVSPGDLACGCTDISVPCVCWSRRAQLGVR